MSNHSNSTTKSPNLRSDNQSKTKDPDEYVVKTVDITSMTSLSSNLINDLLKIQYLLTVKHIKIKINLKNRNTITVII